MLDFLVHTIRRNAGIHFFYRIKALAKEDAFSMLIKRRAIDFDETHYETFPIPKDGDEHELIAIIKENQPESRYELR